MKELNLEEILKEKKISKYEIANTLGISYSTIHDLCKGKRNIDNLVFKNAIAILKYLYSDKELLEFLRNI